MVSAWGRAGLFPGIGALPCDSAGVSEQNIENEKNAKGTSPLVYLLAHCKKIRGKHWNHRL